LAGAGDLVTGGMYVYPNDGVKFGREDAVERNFVKDVKVDSWGARH